MWLLSVAGVKIIMSLMEAAVNIMKGQLIAVCSDLLYFLLGEYISPWWDFMAGYRYISS